MELFPNLIDDEGEASDGADTVDADEESRIAVPHYIPSQDAITSMAAGSGCEWVDLEMKLENKLARNISMKRGVIDQSLKLLRCSRQPFWQDSPRNTEIFLRLPERIMRNNFDTVLPHASFPFTRLPIEFQLSFLSHLAPLLSTAQRLRIFEYASDMATLPRAVEIDNHSILCGTAAGRSIAVVHLARNGKKITRSNSGEGYMMNGDGCPSF